jgi:hypothetical protein
MAISGATIVDNSHTFWKTYEAAAKIAAANNDFAREYSAADEYRVVDFGNKYLVAIYDGGDFLGYL